MNIEITDEQVEQILKQQIKSKVDNFFSRQSYDYMKKLVTNCVTDEVRERVNFIDKADLIKVSDSKEVVELVGNRVTEAIMDALVHSYQD